MAATATLDAEQTKLTNGLVTTGSINFATHATGGVAVTPNLFRLGQLDDLSIDPVVGYVFRYDKANEKVIALDGTLADAGAVDLSALPARFRAEGRF